MSKVQLRYFHGPKNSTTLEKNNCFRLERGTFLSQRLMISDKYVNRFFILSVFLSGFVVLQVHHGISKTSLITVKK